MAEQSVEIERLRIQSLNAELLTRMERVLPQDGIVEFSPGFYLSRLTKPTESTRPIYKPCLCFVVQGSKRALLGNEVYNYDPGHYLVFTVDLPVVFHVDKASEDEPYFGLRLNLDPAIVAAVLLESDPDPCNNGTDVKAIDVQAIDAELLDAVVRLVRLGDSPDERRLLAPLAVREIVYRLLASGQAARLGHLITSAGETQRISEAVGFLRERFREPLKIEAIAREVGMSVSGFHHHFKSVTSLSPLQFQKQMRLQEARRAMLAEEMDAATAGFSVGYEDASYFSRDYKKLFGAPPQHDIANLRTKLPPQYSTASGMVAS
ncbi:MAG TPA: AraC family transcriptional regulator [Pyrinomonadaceae bacterium]|nr:AraC family transcriptional regulator [Pyrinomonadaceae bacterium]